MTRLRFAAAATVAALALLLTGCQAPAGGGGGGDKPERCDGVSATRVGYSPYANSGGYFPFVEQGLKEALDPCGITVTTSDPNADSAKQVSGLENLAAGGAKAVIVCPTDPTAISPIASRLKAQGVLVIGLATAIPEADITFNLDDHEFGLMEGRSAGEWLKANRADDVPEVAILHQDSGGAPLIARHEGVVDGLDEVLGAGNWKLASEAEAALEDEGNAQMSVILQAHPDTDLVVGLNDASALGALSAITSSGRAPGDDIAIVTGGEDKRILEAVKSGAVVSTIGLYPVNQGKIIAETILKALAGEKIEREQIVPAQLVTADNVDDLLTD